MFANIGKVCQSGKVKDPRNYMIPITDMIFVLFRKVIFAEGL